MEQPRQQPVEPGERLPGMLASTVAWLSDSAAADVDGLTAGELLEVIDAAEAVKASVAAVQARATVQFVQQCDDDATSAAGRGELSAREVTCRRSAARAEVALARRCSPSQADRHVGLAKALVSDLPRVMGALSRGEVSEWRATIVARETACLDPHDRRDADARLAPELSRLGDKALGDAARRACIDLDPESVVKRRARAAASRCVSVRPAPDGMAYLSVLGRMTDVVGAHASLLAAERARFVATGDPQVDAARAQDDRGRGAWLADTALERLSGRAEGEAQPVEVSLVMDEPAFFPGRADATGCDHDEDDREGTAAGSSASVREGRVEMPGWGPVPASMAREHLLRLLDEDTDEDIDEHTVAAGGRTDERSRPAGFWLRRLWTSPNGRDLVAMDSRRRFFHGGLRRLLELRDPTCRVPWCDAPARQIDHVVPAAHGGATSAANGAGLCQCHNLVKEEPGWTLEVTTTGLDPGAGPHEIRLTTPTGRAHDCPAPPIFGAGRSPRPSPVQGSIPPDADRWRPDDHRSSESRSALEAVYAELLHAA